MNNKLKKFALGAVACALLMIGVAAGANTFGTPSTILHVATVQWKADSTPPQQQAAIDGIRKMAAEVPGIKNIWIKKVKVQPAEFHTVFAIEFENKAAADAYADHPAHKAWGKIYQPVHEESRSLQITN